MSLQLVRQGIRLRADERSRLPLLDAFTNATPQTWVRAATQFEVALARGGNLVDISNLASVTLEASPYDQRSAGRVFSQTLSGAALDAALTEQTWADGTQQHALFTFSSAEMNVPLGGKTRADLWLVISAVTSQGNPLVCGAGRLTLVEDGAFAGAPAAPGLPTGPAAVQTLTQTAGDVTLPPGTSVAVLTAPLTGALNLHLAASDSYVAGGRLSVIDPGGYSTADKPVNVMPPDGSLLNGGTAAVTVLRGAGTSELLPDAGSAKWIVGQKYLCAPDTEGLTLTGPAMDNSQTLFSVRNGGGEVFGIRGDGNTVTLNLMVNGALASDMGGFTTDGNGNVSAVTLAAASDVFAEFLKLYTPEEGGNETVPEGHAWLYYGADGRLHVRTPDGSNRILAWAAE